MYYPNAYIDFLIHFHGDRDYFECHEILEDYWKQTNPSNRYSIWVGFIQLAVAQYHYRRGNEKGAKKLIIKSIAIFKRNRLELKHLDIDVNRLLNSLNDLQTAYNNGQAYQNINLPISNQKLVNICKDKCYLSGIQWCNDDLVSDLIVHRHLQRVHIENQNERSLEKRKEPSFS